MTNNSSSNPPTLTPAPGFGLTAASEYLGLRLCVAAWSALLPDTLQSGNTGNGSFLETSKIISGATATSLTPKREITFYTTALGS